MDGPPDVVMPAWSLVRGYLSPATLFLLLNVVIGTIALSSRSQRRRQYHRGDGDHQPQHHQQQGYSSDQYAPAQAPAPLARTSSVMERLRSLGLYRFRSGDFPPEYNHGLASANADDSSNHPQQQAQYARSRSEPSVRPPAKKTGNEGEKAARAKVANKKPSPEVKRLGRAPAPARLVQRAPRAPPAARAVVARQEEDAGARPEAAAPGCVDARADDFINKFRQQLQLQRLNSLLNYKEMLNRGA